MNVTVSRQPDSDRDHGGNDQEQHAESTHGGIFEGWVGGSGIPRFAGSRARIFVQRPNPFWAKAIRAPGLRSSGYVPTACTGADEFAAGLRRRRTVSQGVGP